MLLVVACLLVGLFWPFLAEDASLFYRDLSSFHYPLWAATAGQVALGQFPWWSEGIHFGQSIAGNPNYLLFYPLAWLRFLMPPLMALHVFMMAHFPLAALAFYCLARRWKLSAAAAFWGSLAYAFSGVAFSLTCVLNLVPYLVLIPAVLAALEYCLAIRSWRSVSFLGLLAAVTITVFEPYMVFGLLLLGLVCLAGRTPPAWKTFLPAVLSRLLLAGVLAAMLAAPMLVEGVHLLQNASRTEDASTPLYALHPLLSFEFWIPNPASFSFENRTGYRGGALYAGRDPYLITCFAGLATLFLAGAGLSSISVRVRWLALATFSVFVMLSWGQFVPAVGGLMERVPLLEWGRYPQKFAVFAVAVLVMGAARGLDVLGLGAAKARHLRLTAVVAGSAVGAMLLFYGLDDRFSVAAMFPFSILAAILLPVMFWLNPTGRYRQWGLTAAGILLLLELLTANRFAMPFAPSSLMKDPAPVIRLLQARNPAGGPLRVAVEPHPVSVSGGRTDAYWYMSFLKNAGYPYFGLVYGVDYAFDLLLDRTQARWLGVLREEYFRFPLEGRIRVLQRCGIPVMISPARYTHPDLHLAAVIPLGGGETTSVYEVSGVMPRAGFARRWTMTLDIPRPSGMARQWASTEKSPVCIHPASDRDYVDESTAAGQTEEGAGEVTALQWTAGRVRLQTETTGPGMLVLREGYFPGWRVTVDGTEKKLLRADCFFMAVALPAGRHDVRFWYEPAGHPATLVLAGLAVLLALVTLFRRPRRDHPA
ncbi:MAG: YfhO family protein [Acidobacteria bacterium]|nr:YfhO family protein [Acidobacteriota bacterium]